MSGGSGVLDDWTVSLEDDEKWLLRMLASRRGRHVQDCITVPDVFDRFEISMPGDWVDGALRRLEVLGFVSLPPELPEQFRSPLVYLTDAGSKFAQELNSADSVSDVFDLWVRKKSQASILGSIPSAAPLKSDNAEAENEIRGTPLHADPEEDELTPEERIRITDQDGEYAWRDGRLVSVFDDEVHASEGPTKIASNDPTPAHLWTGRPTLRDRLIVARSAAPLLVIELDTLIAVVEGERLNDMETAQALDVLKALHRDLGALINELDSRAGEKLLSDIAQKHANLISLIKRGAKIGVVAPALTIGISHLLAGLTGAAIDSTMVSTIFASIVAMPLVERLSSGDQPQGDNRERDP